MRVALDLDGVVYKFAETYRYMLNLYRGHDFPPVEESWRSWDALDVFLTPEDREWIWDAGVEEGLFRHGHIYKGAVEGVQELCRRADVVVISQRPKNAVLDTLEWLAYNRFPISEVHIIGPERKKTDVPRCDVYIDDSPAVIQDLASKTVARLLLWDRPWNQEWKQPPYVQRVSSWAEVMKLL